MAKNKPVIICRLKQIPNNLPKFHIVVIFEGAGSLISESLIILTRGVDLIIFVVKVHYL